MANDQIAADALRELGQLRARRDAILADLDTASPQPGRVRMDLRTHGPGCWADRRHGDCLAVRVRRILTGAELPELTGEDIDHA